MAHIRTVWRGKRTPYLRKFYSADQWQDANTTRQITDLTARIRSGKSWLQTIPSTDPRHKTWLQAIRDLQSEREALQALLHRRTIARR